jgi:3-(3-hydroxy-phenyl)propionate hydroxylase
MDDDRRVLIAGGGPVGTVTGLALAQQGIPVTVFEQLAEPAMDHRAATLQPSTLDLFDALGITEPILEQGLYSPLFQWRDRVTQDVVAEFDYGRLAEDTAHPYVIQLEQHRTILVALAAAAKLPDFTIVRPVTVTQVDQDDSGVTVDIEHPDGRQERHRGLWLIGCDGGRSLVRKMMGVSFEGFTWQERFNIVTTTNDFAATMGFRLRNYCAHPDRWCSLMKVPGDDNTGLWRCVFPAKEDESDEFVTSDDWIQARFAECLPVGVPYEIVHRNMYNVHQRVAGNFHFGRMLLAGDSAHINNPIGGMGMNSGFQDGINLAGKLGRIFNGADPDSLLDRYDRQRRLTAIEYVQAQSIANKRTLEERDPQIRQENLDRLRRMAADPVQHHDFVLRSSLIAMARKAEEIQ